MPPSALHQALLAALDDEYRSRAIYRVVIDTFGPVQPFSGIIRSEQRHIDALRSLLIARNLPVIGDPYAAGLPAPATLLEACQAGVEAELENVSLYDRLIADAVGDEEVLFVFRALQRASQECHLPSFRRCLPGGQAVHCRGQRYGRQGPCCRAPDYGGRCRSHDICHGTFPLQ
jgi:hypothetical protein